MEARGSEVSLNFVFSFKARLSKERRGREMGGGDEEEGRERGGKQGREEGGREEEKGERAERKSS